MNKQKTQKKTTGPKVTKEERAVLKRSELVEEMVELLLAKASFKLGNFDEAMAVYKKWNTKAPISLIEECGEVCLKDGRLNTAEEVFKFLASEEKLQEVETLWRKLAEEDVKKEQYPGAISIYLRLGDSEKLRELTGIVEKEGWKGFSPEAAVFLKDKEMLVRWIKADPNRLIYCAEENVALLSHFEARNDLISFGNKALNKKEVYKASHYFEAAGDFEGLEGCFQSSLRCLSECFDSENTRDWQVVGTSFQAYFTQVMFCAYKGVTVALVEESILQFIMKCKQKNWSNAASEMSKALVEYQLSRQEKAKKK